MIIPCLAPWTFRIITTVCSAADNSGLTSFLTLVFACLACVPCIEVTNNQTASITVGRMIRLYTPRQVISSARFSSFFIDGNHTILLLRNDLLVLSGVLVCLYLFIHLFNLPIMEKLDLVI